MNDETVDQITKTLAGAAVPRRTVLAVLAAAGLLLATRSSTVAGGKLGGAGGADEFQRFATMARDGSKLGIQPDRTALLGGKLGVGTGDD